MILGFNLKDVDDQAQEFLSEFMGRLGSEWSITSHPFNKSRMEEMDDLYVLQIDPSFPNFLPFGIGFAALIWFIDLPYWVYVVPVLMAVESLAFWDRFFFLMLKIGLRKKGSGAKPIYVSRSRVLEFVCFEYNGTS